jgi:hypothetical protein
MRHDQAIRLALRNADEMAALFGRLGDAEHPRGALLSAFRAARLALKGNLANTWQVAQVLADLRMKISLSTNAILDYAVQYGKEQAEKALSAYGIQPAEVTPINISVNGTKAIISVLEAQAAAIEAVLATDNPSASVLILGDANRVGTLTPSHIVTEADKWVATAINGAFMAIVSDSLALAGAQEEYKRQAIAAVDQKTTDCCLRVHGQVVGMREDFHLTGTPRYADNIHTPPFHWKCRTSVALIHIQDIEDELTAQMRVAARNELLAREVTGKRETIRPSHARSGRR